MDCPPPMRTLALIYFTFMSPHTTDSSSEVESPAGSDNHISFEQHVPTVKITRT